MKLKTVNIMVITKSNLYIGNINAVKPNILYKGMLIEKTKNKKQK